jgi:hypothetical protein
MICHADACCQGLRSQTKKRKKKKNPPRPKAKNNGDARKRIAKIENIRIDAKIHRYKGQVITCQDDEAP